MGRQVDQNDVNRVAEELVLAGERPTVDRIRQELGRGSPNNIGRLLEVWWQTLAHRLNAARQVPPIPDVPPAIVEIAATAWDVALREARAHAERELAERVQAVADEAAALACERQRLLDDTARAVAACAAAEASLGASQREAELLSAQMADQARALAEAAGARSRLDDRLDAAEAANAQLQVRLHEVLDAQAADRSTHAAYVQGLEERSAREIDRARQETREAQTALKAEARRAHGAEADLQARLDQALREVQGLRGELEAARRAVEEAREDGRREGDRRVAVAQQEAMAAEQTFVQRLGELDATVHGLRAREVELHRQLAAQAARAEALQAQWQGLEERLGQVLSPNA